MQRKVPSAIENITLNRATFTDVPVADLTFVNFFYGNNGAGKSSIAHAIEEDDGVVWADGKSADDYDVLVYNQDFINENFVNYGDLKGVFIFGEEDIEAKKRIAELTEEKKKKSDPYDVYDYDDPEDFYYDNYDDFECYEDAEDYFDDHNY